MKGCRTGEKVQPITVEEPSIDDTIKILEGLRDRYEAHHGVKITDDALKAAAELSARYITDRFLPDKAIDLMDEAASKVRIFTVTIPPDLKDLEEKLEQLSKEKEEAISIQDFERAAEIRNEEKQTQQEVEERKNSWKDKDSEAIVTDEEIANVVSDWTGVPVNKLKEEESERLLNMEKIIHGRVIGQQEAVKSVARAIRRARVGLKDPKRPVGSFIFLGPTGVGKTELSKALAEAMFGDEDAMIRIDMSNIWRNIRFQTKDHRIRRFDEGGQLTEKVRKNHIP